MKTEFRKSFEKDLSQFRDKGLLSKIKSIVEAVEAAQSLNAIVNVKKLKGSTQYYRIRVGDYRIGLFLADDTVRFVRVLHRREFYRFFHRSLRSDTVQERGIR